jgi:hypothetical protein
LSFRQNIPYIVEFFVWFYGKPTQFRSYGFERGNTILVNLGFYKLKATPRVKPHDLLELKDV